MGLLKTALFIGAGFWSARAISRLNRRVLQIPVLKNSKLKYLSNKRADFYSDTFVIRLPERVRYSGLRVDVTDLARAFFSSPRFGLEKFLLKIHPDYVPDDRPLSMKEFLPDEQIYAWRVASRNDHEILLHWYVRDVSGLTWFGVSQESGNVYFGSSIGRATKNYYGQTPAYVTPLSNWIQSLNQLKQNDVELWRRLWNLFVGTYWSIGIFIHQLYSRLLLESAMKRLVLELDS